MSSLSIAPFFPWSRMVVTGQSVSEEADLAVVDLRPDRRYAPLCHLCGQKAGRVCSHQARAVRDLDMASARVQLRLSYRKVYCPACRAVVVEELEPLVPWQRVTRRLAACIHQLCAVMTVQDVAAHFGLNWKTVKDIDKAFLQERYAPAELGELRVLAVDEFSLRKGRHYVTVVIDYETGRVLHVAEGNRSESLASFFGKLNDRQKAGIEAIAMDMWDPYIKAVRECVPHVKIVFDLFHAVQAFSRIIDEVRLAEYRKASEQDREVIKGSKWLLLKTPQALRQSEREHLDRLLKLNCVIATVMTLKDQLRPLWRSDSRQQVARAMAEWCALARRVGHGKVERFARRLEHYGYGILNHCDYPIHTSKLEGINNKIKVIKRRAYGFHDLGYFALKIHQAFDPENRSLFGR